MHCRYCPATPRQATHAVGVGWINIGRKRFPEIVCVCDECRPIAELDIDPSVHILLVNAHERSNPR